MKCPVLGCGKEINGMTGLQELIKLRKHFARKHSQINMEEALEIRVIAEGIEDERKTRILN